MAEARNRPLEEPMRDATDAPTSSAGGGTGGDASPGVASTPSHLPKVFRGDPNVDDAFSTLMQWLHHRIPFTR